MNQYDDYKRRRKRDYIFMVLFILFILSPCVVLLIYGLTR